MNVGVSLLTLVPGRLGGSESYAASLLSSYAAGHGPDRTTVLATPRVASSYESLASGRVELAITHRFRIAPGGPGRLGPLLAGMTLPWVFPASSSRTLDVIHYPLTVPIPRVRIPRVVSLHDVQHHELPQLFSRPERAFRSWAYDRAAKTAARVITGTAHAKGQIAARLGVPRERIDVIPHGVDHDRFNPEPQPEDHALDVPDRFLVYPANMWPHKNHERLFQAFARRSDRALKLVLTGQRREDRQPLPEGVLHLGHVNLDQMPAMYRRATALVFPSLFEGYGFPIVEAMASGCPVIASSTGAVAEVAGDAAVLFDPEAVDQIATAIDRIAADAGLREELVASGRSHVSALTWEASAAAHCRVYERAAAA